MGKQALHYHSTDESVNYRPLEGGRKPSATVVERRRPSCSSQTSCSTESSCSEISSSSGSISSDQSKSWIIGRKRSVQSSSGRSGSIKSSLIKAAQTTAKTKVTAAICALCKGEVRYFRVRFSPCGHEMHGECCWRYAATVADDIQLNAGEKCARCHWERQQKRERQRSIDSWQSAASEQRSGRNKLFSRRI